MITSIAVLAAACGGPEPTPSPVAQPLVATPRSTPTSGPSSTPPAAVAEVAGPGLLAPFPAGLTATVIHGYNDPVVGEPCVIPATLDHCANQRYGFDLRVNGDDTRILAPVDGTLTRLLPADASSPLGPCLLFTTADGLNINLCHVGSLALPEGTAVQQGCVLGTRDSSWIHLSVDDRRGGGPSFPPIPLTGAHRLEGVEYPDEGEAVRDQYHADAITTVASTNSPRDCGGTTPADAGPPVTATWRSPKDGLRLGTASLELSARLVASSGTRIAKVAYTMAWGQKRPRQACTATKPTSGGLWTCAADLYALGAVPGTLSLSFNVVDAEGHVLRAPAGSRSVVLTGATTARVKVPLVSCPTDYGYLDRNGHPVTARPLPATQKLTLPIAVAGEVAMYATNDYRVLGPRGWRCSGLEGADGSGVITLRSRSDPDATVWYGSSGANGSMADWFACWYFKAARRAEAALGIDCAPTRPPARETVTLRTATTVLLADPARVKGSLNGSGGRHRTVGGIWYRGGDNAAASTLGCSTPGNSRRVCDAITADWRTRNGAS